MKSHTKRSFTLLGLCCLSAILLMGWSCELFQITCATPVISPAGGTITPADSISLSCDTSNTTLYYTTDGTAPSQDNGTAYTAPFRLEATATVRAIAIRSNYNSSAEIQASYTLNLDGSDTITINPAVPATALSGAGLKTINLDLGDTAKDVYFVFSNGSSGTAELPVAYNAALGRPLATTPVTTKSTPVRNGPAGQPPRGTPVSGHPAVDTLSPELFSLDGQPGLRRQPPAARAVSRYEVGNELTFFGDTSGSNTLADPVTVTLRYQSPAITTLQGVAGSSDANKTRTLRVWVANDCWTEGGSKAFKVTPDMVEAYGQRFLAEGLNNDIFDWVTNVYGAEWGDTSQTAFADLTIAATGYIDIVLYDISNDNNNYASGNSLILGYFYGRDNFSIYTGTNQKICFAIDAVSFADPRDYNGETIPWSLDASFWPNEQVSTLAHEFQHMISFYQNLSDTDTALGTYSTWVEELQALCAEDLVADKIHASGPRGVAYDNYTPGDSNNTAGRLAEFNYRSDSSLTEWGSQTADYALAYAFGAWLLRNHGGVAVMQALMGQDGRSASTLVAAVNALGGTDLAFADLLARFGAAVLLSDRSGLGAPWSFNSGTTAAVPGYSSSVNGLDYHLGDINFYNYRFTDYATIDQVGPKVQTAAFAAGSNLPAGSNSYYLAGSGLTGARSWTIWLPDELRMSVVVK